MRRALVNFAVLVVLAFGAASPAAALGFGRTVSPSLLGQPLDFTATVRLVNDETLERPCVSAAVHAGDNLVAPEQVRVQLRPGADAAERLVRVTTLRALDEPVVTIEIGIGCGARMVRSFVAFLDPPVVRLASTGDPAPELQAGVSASAGDVDARASARTLSYPKRVQGHPHAHAGALAAHPSGRRSGADAGAAVEPAAPPRHRVARGVAGRVALAKASAGPRLQLEAPALPAARPKTSPERPSEIAMGAAQTIGSAAAAEATALAGASTASAPGAASAAGADPERARLVAELEQERARLQALEGAVAQLRGSEQAMQRTITVLQTRLRDAESDRYSNPLVWLLGGSCVVLLAATALAWRRPPRGRRWWDATHMPASAAAPTPGADDGPSVEAGKPPLAEEPADAPWTYRRPALEPSIGASSSMPAASIGGLEVTTVIDNALLARMAAGDAEPLREEPETAAPIDALFDLAQQAEFYVALGQEEQAIELLASQLHGVAGASPMPHLQLLALHRRRGERAAWMRVADAMQARFGGEPPSWTEQADEQRPLEAHAAVIERLQRLWSWPLEAMHALEGWLLRRHPNDERFGLEAHAEMVLLYALAREHADAETGVDLLLPLEDTQPADVGLPASAYRISRFGAVEAPFRGALDLDISAPGPLDSRPSELRQAI